MKVYNEKLNEMGVWMPVNADNVFEFAGCFFRIPYGNKNYRVSESYRNSYNYSNISLMDSVFAVVEHENGDFKINFYDENSEPILNIKMLGGGLID